MSLAWRTMTVHITCWRQADTQHVSATSAVSLLLCCVSVTSAVCLQNHRLVHMAYQTAAIVDTINADPVSNFVDQPLMFCSGQRF